MICINSIGISISYLYFTIYSIILIFLIFFIKIVKINRDCKKRETRFFNEKSLFFLLDFYPKITIFQVL